MRRISVGTPTDLAAHSSGYSGNGESIYTRQISRHEPQFSGRVSRIRGAGERTLAQKIEYERARLAHTEAALRIEDDPQRRERLTRSTGIKTAFLHRLEYRRQFGSSDRHDTRSIDPARIVAVTSIASRATSTGKEYGDVPFNRSTRRPLATRFRQ